MNKFEGCLIDKVKKKNQSESYLHKKPTLKTNPKVVRIKERGAGQR